MSRMPPVLRITERHQNGAALRCTVSAVVLWGVLGGLQANAADWQRLDGLPDGNEHSYDASKVQFELDEVTYWRRIRFANPVTVPKGRVALAMFRERLNCRVHSVQALNWLLYDADGRVLEQADGAEAEARPIVPDTIGDAFANKLCPLRPAEPTVPNLQDNTVPGAAASKPGTLKAPAVPAKPGAPTVPNVPVTPAPQPVPEGSGDNNMIVIPGNGEIRP